MDALVAVAVLLGVVAAFGKIAAGWLGMDRRSSWRAG